MLSNQDDLEVFKLIHANSKRFPKVLIKGCEPPKTTKHGKLDDSFEVIEEAEIPSFHEKHVDDSIIR